MAALARLRVPTAIVAAAISTSAAAIAPAADGMSPSCPGAPAMMMTGAPMEPRFYFDAQMPWMHGYIQEIPAFEGFYAFRPYNYKHVLDQSQVAAGWGISPTAPYSHQLWVHPKPAAVRAEADPQPQQQAVPVSGEYPLPWSLRSADR